MEEPYDGDYDGEDEHGGVRIIEERPPLRDGKVFLDYDDRRTIADNLKAAYVALNRAFRGIWIEKALERGWPREYWDEDDVDELDELAFDAMQATNRAWKALDAVRDAHATQIEDALDAADGDD